MRENNPIIVNRKSTIVSVSLSLPIFLSDITFMKYSPSQKIRLAFEKGVERARSRGLSKTVGHLAGKIKDVKIKYLKDFEKEMLYYSGKVDLE